MPQAEDVPNFLPPQATGVTQQDGAVQMGTPPGTPTFVSTPTNPPGPLSHDAPTCDATEQAVLASLKQTVALLESQCATPPEAP